MCHKGNFQRENLSEDGTEIFAALLSFTIKNLQTATSHWFRQLTDHSNLGIFTIFLNSKRSISFSETNLINRKENNMALKGELSGRMT